MKTIRVVRYVRAAKITVNSNGTPKARLSKTTIPIIKLAQIIFLMDAQTVKLFIEFIFLQRRKLFRVCVIKVE